MMERKQIKEIIKLLVPPLLLQEYRALRGRLGNVELFGNFRTWDEAMGKSTGYDSEIILEKTKKALMKVKNGEAVYERDSVIFDKVHYAWPLLASLMLVAAQAKGKLNVLDFGGSLGSTYFQNRVFLSRLPNVRWNIIEQPRHVEIGKKWFEDEYLKFYPCVEDCLSETQPNVIILSGVLQYLEHPYEVLSTLLGLSCDYVVIDRTPFHDGPIDRLCVQSVPPIIYVASYPSWIFSTQRFRSYLGKKWKIMEEFEGFDRLKAPIQAIWKGWIIVRQGGDDNCVDCR